MIFFKVNLCNSNGLWWFLLKTSKIYLTFGWVCGLEEIALVLAELKKENTLQEIRTIDVHILPPGDDVVNIASFFTGM